MPLPQSAIPGYQPKSFLSPSAERAQTKGMELYFRYHPAVFKMKTFELLLEDEKFRAKTDADKRKLLSSEMEQIDGLLARYRSTGAGPSGAANLAGEFGQGKGSKSSRGGVKSGGQADFLVDMSRNENDRFGIVQKGRSDALREYDKLLEIPDPSPSSLPSSWAGRTGTARSDG